MGKHTPGPWAVKSGSVWTKHPRYGDATQFARIAYMDRDCEYTRPTERDANARLIAAAPELLSALEALLTHSEVTYTAPTCSRPSLATQCEFEADLTIQQARAAITKARGE